ncbi:hypothetical protein GNT69_20270 [Bacillus sp. B15-48]|nr:hypothetical protein [Bacillus sp. B15-48]
MKIKILAVTILVAIVLAACSAGNTNDGNSAQEIETENIKEVVRDYSEGNIKNQSASITSQKLIVTDSEKGELTYDLPEDEFFVSIAPYVNQTHP